MRNSVHSTQRAPGTVAHDDPYRRPAKVAGYRQLTPATDRDQPGHNHPGPAAPHPHIYAASAFGGVGSPLNHFHATRLRGKRMIQMVAMMIRK